MTVQLLFKGQFAVQTEFQEVSLQGYSVNLDLVGSDTIKLFDTSKTHKKM